MNTRPIEVRFWEKVKKIEGKCWEWIGGKNNHGYGMIFFKRKNYLAHRLSWKLNKCEIPKEMYASSLMLLLLSP